MPGRRRADGEERAMGALGGLVTAVGLLPALVILAAGAALELRSCGRRTRPASQLGGRGAGAVGQRRGTTPDSRAVTAGITIAATTTWETHSMSLVDTGVSPASSGGTKDSTVSATAERR
jgi:hypothetical protein